MSTSVAGGREGWFSSLKAPVALGAVWVPPRAPRQPRPFLPSVVGAAAVDSINGAAPVVNRRFEEEIKTETTPDLGAVTATDIDIGSGIGLKPKIVYRNLSPAELYEKALQYEKGTHIVANGALAALSGEKRGRSPKDKRVVREETSQDEVWWGEGSPNYEIDENSFHINRELAVNYLNGQDRVFVVDAFANWNTKARFKVRVVTLRAYHALFMHNMLIRPTAKELEDFGEPDFLILNAGPCKANKQIPYVTSDASVALNLKDKQMVILGTEYAGEMKKGIFTVMHYWMPKQNILSLHSGCNIGKDNDVSLFFGLSGTGKTTLSADPHRPLIGDDEHCWAEDGIFNIEGGCYAKCINLKQTTEPEIWNALRFGAVLENVVFDPDTRCVQYDSSLLTENTRASYPIDFMGNVRIPCVGPHPKNIILLCCDAFGVLPPVSKLTLEQTMYHFISGYTAKVAGTEVGVVEPEATFSACFGSAFLMWHPMKYASMLAEKMQKHGTTAWLVNTGWTGGRYGVGRRMSLKHTRLIIDAIHADHMADSDFITTPIFNLHVPKSIPGVPSEVLLPESQWSDKADFCNTLKGLADMFVKNFKKFEDGGGYVSSDTAKRICSGGPADLVEA